jgi:hypothetical protein
MRAAKRRAVSNSTLRLATLMPLTPSENRPPEFFPTVTVKVTGRPPVGRSIRKIVRIALTGAANYQSTFSR